MQLIKPAFISAEIMNIIDEANELLILVSPYNNFTGWRKMQNKLESALSRVKRLEYIVRASDYYNSPDKIEELRVLGFDPIEVPGLHCKFYINDNDAIVTSMNLLQSSDEAAIEIAYKTETKEEHAALIDFYSTHVFSKRVRIPFDLNVEIHKLNLSLNKKLGENGGYFKLDNESVKLIHHWGYEFTIREGFLRVSTWPTLGFVVFLKSNLHLIELPEWNFIFQENKSGTFSKNIKMETSLHSNINSIQELSEANFGLLKTKVENFMIRMNKLKDIYRKTEQYFN